MAQVKVTVLLWKIGFLTTLIILTCYIIIMATGPMWNNNNYLAATIDKQKLLKETRSPKVILVGGSNVAFGWDSRITQHLLGVPVVNMGLHAGIGLNYMLEEIRPFVGHGDLVVVMPEYEHFYGSLLNGGITVWQLICYAPGGYRNLQSPGQYLALLKSFKDFFYSQLLSLFVHWARVLRIREFPSSENYSRSLFNDYGDFVGHLRLPQSWYGEIPTKVDDRINEETFSGLERFSKYAASKKAQMVVVWPSVPEPFYLARKEWIERVASKITAYPGIMVHGHPRDYVLPVNNFFDTYYHLNAAGRHKRTLDISPLLHEMYEVQGK